MRINRLLAITAALLLAASAPVSAAMLKGSQPLEAAEYDRGYGMLNPRRTGDDGPEILVLPPEDPEHYYDHYLSPVYPAGGSAKDWLAFYERQRNLALKGLEEAEDYYEKCLRKSEAASAQEMIELYKGILNGNVEIPEK